MTLFSDRRLAFAFACAALTASCGGSGLPSTPSLTSPTRPSSLSSVRPADYYDDYPDPYGPTPVDPTVPIPAPPVPAPPAQPSLTIDIVGAIGPGAFAPNPLQAAMGDLLAWKNSDLLPHHIVLDDGTVVGTIAPGQTSVAVPLTTATYHCTLHPSMVGSISIPGATGPPPAAQPPPVSEPPPAYEPPPYDNYRRRR